MTGHIRQRSPRSWELKFDTGRDPLTGKRKTRFVTVKAAGRKAAQAELRRLLTTVDEGVDVIPSKLSVGEYVRAWLKSATHLAPKTRERYEQLAEAQIIPHLGAIPLQKLRPTQIHQWHATLFASGGKHGGPLSARTAGHAHRVLHRALADAVAHEVLARNVASAVRPPKVAATEIAILSAEQIADVLARLEGHRLHPIVALALGSGLRRGELLALAWGALDLDAATLRVERALEETKGGVRFKTPKTRAGHRSVSLPNNVVDILRTHRRKQSEQRLLLGMGRLSDHDLVFSKYDGSPYPPDTLSRDWWRATGILGLPRVSFHSLRHSHASALIAAGLDVVTVSRRLGHGSPAITLSVYAHAFTKTDKEAAEAMERAMSAGTQ